MCAIYASHLLEHIYLEEAKALLMECHRVLRPGGALRIVVPDLKSIVSEYFREVYDETPTSLTDSSIAPADELNLRLRLRSPSAPTGSVFQRVYSALKDFHSHKWMYDASSLSSYLRGAGFVDVRQMDFRQSRIEGIEAVEQASRVLNGEGVCVEGVKPDDLPLGTKQVRHEAGVL